MTLETSTPKNIRDNVNSEMKNILEKEENISCIRNILDNQILKHPQFSKWISWHIEKEWVDHILRMGTIVEKKNIKYVANITETPQKELERINLEAKDKPERFVEQVTPELERISTADVLIRGLRYDTLARLTQKKVLHHHVRRPLFSIDQNVKGHSINVGRVFFIIAFAIGMIIREGIHKESVIDLWLNKVETVKRHIEHVWEVWMDNKKTSVKYIDKLPTEIAISFTAHLLEKAKMEPESRMVRKLYELSSSLSGGFLSLIFSGYLGPWPGFIAGIGTTEGLRSLEKRIMTPLERKWVRKQLSEKAGRIETTLSVREFKNHNHPNLKS